MCHATQTHTHTHTCTYLLLFPRVTVRTASAEKTTAGSPPEIDESHKSEARPGQARHRARHRQQGGRWQEHRMLTKNKRTPVYSSVGDNHIHYTIKLSVCTLLL